MEMEEGTIQDALEETLRAEIDVIERVRESQTRMFKSIRERDWVLLTNESAIIVELSEEFASLEKELSDLIALSSGGEEMSFYSVTASFPQGQREVINSLFRELKRLLVLAKTESSAFAEFVSGQKASLSALVEHILPARKGRVYNKYGSLSSSGGEGIILDRVF